MVLLGVLAGLGAGAIDAGLNSYVAANYGEGMMQWLHAFYVIGITSVPIIMSISLSTMDSWRVRYRVVGGFQLLLAICFSLTLSLWARKPAAKGSDEPKLLTDYKTPMLQTMRQSLVWLSALLFLMYCGAEVSFGTWTYSLLTESRGIAPSVAGFFAGSYWGMFTIGRILSRPFAKRAGVYLLVQSGIVAALLGTGLLIWNPSQTANVAAVGLIGLAITPIFPALMSGTIQRVGVQQSGNTIGIQMSATGLGTVIIPSSL